MFLILALAARPTLAADPTTFEDLPSRQEARRVFLEGDPRAKRWFGLGMGFGLQGISSLHLGVRVLGILNPVLTVSPIGTLDVSVRANLLPSAWSPQLGVGYVIGYPYELFGDSPYKGCGFLHIDAGAELATRSAFTFTPGVSFADLDCDADVNILPIPYVHVAWYFGR